MTKHKWYTVKDRSIGEYYEWGKDDFILVLIDDVASDIKHLSEFANYAAMEIAITKLKMLLVEMEDTENNAITDIVVKIANDYEYSVYEMMEVK